MPELLKVLIIYLQTYCQPFSKESMLFISNFVTTMGILLTIILAHNIVYSGCIYRAVFLALLIQLLDCLDGAIARKCNKKTKLSFV